MNKSLLLGILLLPGVCLAQGKWVTFEAHCELKKQDGELPESTDCVNSVAPVITKRGFLSTFHWAGTVTQLYYDLKNFRVTNYRVKVSIVDFKSPYACGTEVEMNPAEAVEVTSHTIRHRMCQ